MDEVKDVKTVHAVAKKEESFTFDQNTVMFQLYLMYKANLITRNHLAHFMRVIKETDPKLNVMEYLVKEVAKI